MKIISFIMLFTILIIRKVEKLYIKIYHPDKVIINTNYSLFQLSKYKLTIILYLKKGVFYMKATIEKFKEDIKYVLYDFYVKIDQ